jgi:rod shape-determining protein MreD
MSSADLDLGEAPPRAGAGRALLLPGAMAIIGLVLMAAPVLAPLPFAPHWTLLIVGVWAYYQPRLMPPALALGIGVATDLVAAGVLGVEASLLALAALLLPRGVRRIAPRAPLEDWALAGGVIALYLATRTELAVLGGLARPTAMPWPQWLATWALVPAVTRASAYLYGKLILRG